MNTIAHAPVASRASWDGNQVVFDLRIDGADVACAISRAALEFLADRRCFKKEQALACFDQHRPVIEDRAARKMRARPGDLCGRLTLWEDDVEPALTDDAVLQPVG